MVSTLTAGRLPALRSPAEARSSTEYVNVGDLERVLTLLGGVGLVAYGLRRRSWPALALGAVGGTLLYRARTGHCPVYQALGVSTREMGMLSNPLNRAIHVTETITVDAPPAALYSFWRNFENLPTFMVHLKDVRVHSATHSHWVARGPSDVAIEWDALITDERTDEFIAWRSLEGADVDNTGMVEFAPAPGGRGTEVKVTLEYRPPAGVIGAAVARIFGAEPGQQIADDLCRLKQIMEAGELATTEDQPHGPEQTGGWRRTPKRPALRPVKTLRSVETR